MRKVALEAEASIVELYRTTPVSADKLGSQFGLTGQGIRQMLVRNGCPVRDKHDRCYRIPVREDAFDDLTPEALYWIAWIATSGYVFEEGYKFVFSVTLKNRHVVEALSRYLKSGSKIVEIRRRGGRLVGVKVTVYSKKLVGRLIELGVTQGKSTVDPHPTLAGSAAFWLGAVEGEGWYKTADPEHRLGFASISERLAEKFHQYFLSVFPEHREKIRKRFAGTSRVCWEIAGVAADEFASYLLDHAGIPGACSSPPWSCQELTSGARI